MYFNYLKEGKKSSARFFIAPTCKPNLIGCGKSRSSTIQMYLLILFTRKSKGIGATCYCSNFWNRYGFNTGRY